MIEPKYNSFQPKFHLLYKLMYIYNLLVPHVDCAQIYLCNDTTNFHSCINTCRKCIYTCKYIRVADITILVPILNLRGFSSKRMVDLHFIPIRRKQCGTWNVKCSKNTQLIGAAVRRTALGTLIKHCYRDQKRARQM